MLYGELTIWKAVPLTIGLVSTSNPHLPILDTMSKHSHNNDLQVAMIKRLSKKAPPPPKQRGLKYNSSLWGLGVKRADSRGNEAIKPSFAEHGVLLHAVVPVGKRG